ncbi:MAG: type II secretion system GspH family protein [Fusobacterium sp.]|nr:type II secretion system GspH family protein [Fusobacterium sp.]
MKNKLMFMLTGGGGRSLTAFTMAEILLSLTIIGVVAAITLPSLTGNINERTWNTQRKALFARFSQAIALMPALNGYGTLDGTTDTAAETFITSGLSKVLKINNICSDNLKDCGITSNINTTGSAVPVPENWSALNPLMISDSYSLLGSHSMLNSKAAAFETANGESIIVYYNSACRGDNFTENTSYLIEPYVCANLIYDLNGTKGPNTVGKDIGFMTILYSSDSKVVAPTLEGNTTNGKNLKDAQSYCRDLDNARLPNREEAMAIAVNKKLLPSITSESILSSYLWQNGLVGHMTMSNKAVFGKILKDDTSKDTQCVKR